MELIRGIHNIKSQHKNCAVTIGNFDGIHLGHQRVLSDLVKYAKKLNLPATVIFFEPQPLEYFRDTEAPARLLRFREKWILLKELNIDRVLCLHFNRKLANLSAEDFVKEILVDKLGIKFLLIGDDFHFGKQRQGNFDLLQQLAKKYSFEIKKTETVFFNNERIGSSRVREALAQGNFSLATQLLKRPYQMTGRVIYGHQRGTQILNIPTANIALHRKISPLNGVFVVRVYGLEKPALLGVANIGTRPTLDGKTKFLEIHLLDFNADIHGRFLQIEFIKKIRDEKKFPSIEALKQRIQEDIAIARDYFK